MSLQGYNGAIALDGSVLCVKRANANETVDDLDTTSTCADTDSTGSAYETRLNGVKRLELTIEADFPTAGQGDPPLVDAGGNIEIVMDAGYQIQGTFMAIAFTYSFEVKGLVSYSATFKSNGIYIVS
ncbi:phage tail protein [Tuwongella immobilis]|uniref:Uncharacterized protein n=1 Tax=Tuwongella immobilis TaxID=692036 RepID=A0A6C2YRL9_9BACT|nr:hypothetical protein [Tuwongella immobilis]VIP03974.1 unnamed protein product [Tuwongella immobilis]VTS05315.1 unnamed protein product [Tuwongella immobilis]